MRHPRKSQTFITVIEIYVYLLIVWDGKWCEVLRLLAHPGRHICVTLRDSRLACGCFLSVLARSLLSHRCLI